MRIFLLLALLEMLAGCAQRVPPLPQGKAAELGGACLYETQLVPDSRRSRTGRQWLFLVSDRLIERRDKTGVESGIWRKSESGEITFQRAFHREKRVITYTAGDLSALGRHREWSDLSGLVDNDVLRRLELWGQTSVLGAVADRYVGRVEGAEIEVDWLPVQALPAKVREITPEREVETRLIECHALEEAPWFFSILDGYDFIDFADVGDHEADPFLRRYLHSEGIVYPHRGH